MQPSWDKKVTMETLLLLLVNLGNGTILRHRHWITFRSKHKTGSDIPSIFLEIQIQKFILEKDKQKFFWFFPLTKIHLFLFFLFNFFWVVYLCLGLIVDIFISFFCLDFLLFWLLFRFYLLKVLNFCRLLFSFYFFKVLNYSRFRIKIVV